MIDVQTPLSGTIVERNTKAEDEPNILNSEKPEENWLFKLMMWIKKRSMHYGGVNEDVEDK